MNFVFLWITDWYISAFFLHARLIKHFRPCDAHMKSPKWVCDNNPSDPLRCVLWVTREQGGVRLRPPNGNIHDRDLELAAVLYGHADGDGGSNMRDARLD